MKASVSSSSPVNSENDLSSSSSSENTSRSNEEETTSNDRDNSENEENNVDSCQPLCAPEKEEEEDNNDDDDDDVDLGKKKNSFLVTSKHSGSIHIQSIPDDDIVDTIVNENRDKKFNDNDSGNDNDDVEIGKEGDSSFLATTSKHSGGSSTSYVHVPLFWHNEAENNQNNNMHMHMHIQSSSKIPQDPGHEGLHGRLHQPSASVDDANYHNHNHEEININQNRLHQALSDAVHHSQGIVAVEVWTLNERRTHIIRPEGAYYRDPNYRPPSHLNVASARLALMRLEDESREDHHDVMPTEPGKGLAGQLWADTKKAKPLNTSLSAFGSNHGGGGGGGGNVGGVNLRRTRSLTDSFRRGLQAHIPNIFQSQHQAATHWTDLGFLFRDPDHIPDERLQSFVLAGIGLAAGVAYNLRGEQGLVIFMARSDTPIDILQEESNATFLSCAADCIGAALAISEPRTSSLYLKRMYGDPDRNRDHDHDHDMATNKHDETNNENGSAGDENQLESGSFLSGHDQNNKAVGNFSIDNMGRRIGPRLSFSRTSSKASSKFGSVASHHGSLIGKPSSRSTFHAIVMKVNMLWEKSVGPKTARPPAPMPLPESVWTFIGCFASLSLISYLSYSIPTFKGSSDVFAFPMGPIGALVALQFGLTAAPASQPRNILFGTAIAGSTGLCFGYFTAWPHWLRLALGTSTAIALTAKAGVIHPPSGALAAIFCLSGYHWGHLLLALFGCALSVIMSMLINNLNEKRHYPMYWSVKPSCTKREI